MQKFTLLTKITLMSSNNFFGSSYKFFINFIMFLLYLFIDLIDVI